MLLKKIVLNNFRQYYGYQELEFSQLQNKNVTVVHGENGSGKTALLHSFGWCLYGDLNLPNPENICNEHALSNLQKDQSIESYVELHFEAFSKKYSLKRFIVVERTNDDRILYGEPQVSMQFIGHEGQSERIENYTEEINRILPKDLRTYFFFDGERIDNLTKSGNNEDIEKAIKSMMGLEILERSIRHTDQARKRFREELKELGDAKTQEVYSELEKLEQERDTYIEKRQIKQDNIKVLDKQIEEREIRLTQLEGAKKLQELRESKREELYQAESRLKEIEKELVNTMSKQGYLAFTSPIMEKADEILDSNGPEEQFVKGITKDFIDKLIQDGKCICGEEIKEDSIHLNHLQELAQATTSNQLINTVNYFKQNGRTVEERKENLFKNLDRLKKAQSSESTNIRLLNEKIQEISTQLSEHTTEDIAALEERRKELSNQKDKINQDIGSINGNIERLDEEIVELENEQKKMELKETKSNLAQKRMQTCRNLIDVMENILEIRETIVKEQLQDRISKVYSQFLRKNYSINLSEDYMLNVFNEKGNPVAMSQGERQITSLSFIGAIVDIARETFNKETQNAFDEGGIYPLVMDSPFGALDSDHRERVAKGIYKLADQVIVIVSTSQWEGEVEEQMKSLVGKEYKLEYNDPRYNKDKPYEYTNVKEVN
ncbi:AAA family ATPase [Allobacillus sp. GCM10007491]|uniref:Nuclease SbcCD subunit C n=1 Tax=Allobacillus saliphilus TaxID=2912308 RepID=A0A941CTX9_9BACI|nr:AAA family ATPase [Allobacillus saliphilus]